MILIDNLCNTCKCHIYDVQNYTGCSMCLQLEIEVLEEEIEEIPELTSEDIAMKDEKHGNIKELQKALDTIIKYI